MGNAVYKSLPVGKDHGIAGIAGKYNKGKKIIIFPFDGSLYPAVLSSLTSAS